MVQAGKDFFLWSPLGDWHVHLCDFVFSRLICRSSPIADVLFFLVVFFLELLLLEFLVRRIDASREF